MREATLLITEESKAVAKWAEMRSKFFTKKPKPPSKAQPVQSNNNTNHASSMSPAPISIHNLPQQNRLVLPPLSNDSSTSPRNQMTSPSLPSSSHAGSCTIHDTSTVNCTINQQQCYSCSTIKRVACRVWMETCTRLIGQMVRWSASVLALLHATLQKLWQCQHPRIRINELSSQKASSLHDTGRSDSRTWEGIITALLGHARQHLQRPPSNDVTGADAEMLNELRLGVTEYAARKLLVQLKFAETEHVDGFRAVDTLAGDKMFTTTSSSHGRVTIDFTNKRCSCGLTNNMGLMCRHVMRYMLTVERCTRPQLATSCIEWADNRWKQLSQQSFMNASTQQESASATAYRDWLSDWLIERYW